VINHKDHYFSKILNNKRIINELKTIILMGLRRVISNRFASVFRRANKVIALNQKRRAITKFKKAKEAQEITQIISDKKAKKYYPQKSEKSKQNFKAADNAAKKNAKQIKKRKHAFSDLLVARAKTKRQLSAIEKKAHKLTRGIYRGDFCSFRSYSGNIYEGAFRRITTAKVRTNSGIKEVLAIEIVPSGKNKSIKLAVDLLEKSNN
jgi:hypothetical protein